MDIYNLITIVILILLFYYFYNNNLAEHYSSDKTVYIVWNDIVNKQGLGDKIRGTIAIYQYCRSNNIKCIFDASLSGFGQFLKNSNSNNPNLNIDTEIVSVLNIYDDEFAIKKLIDNELKNKDTAYVFCNLFPKTPLSSEDLEFLNYMMEPIDDLKYKVDNIKNELMDNYTIQHFRFKDGTDPDINKMIECYQLLEKTYKETDILMSNSIIFRNYILARKQIKTIKFDNCKELHVGYNNSSDIIEFTLIEYYIITKSKFIHTYSEYGWVSAFIYYPSKFYNIPIENQQI